MFLFSALTDSIWFYFLEWQPREFGWEFLRGGVASRLGLLTLVFFLVAAWRPRSVDWILYGMALYWPLRAAHVFFARLDGSWLYGDDHPSFLFRLATFVQSAPMTAIYNPYWNGGRVDAAPAAAGLYGLGNLFYPLLRLMQSHEAYSWIVLILAIGLPPLLCALAVHLAGGGRRAVLAGFLLGLLPSRVVAKWLLHFGTLGAGLSLPWILPVSAALYAVMVLGRRDLRVYAVLVLSSVFLLAWPGALMLSLPLLLAAGINLPKLDRKGWTGLLVCAGLIALLACIPYYDLHTYAELGKFSRSDGLGHALPDWVEMGVKNGMAVLTETNPLLLLGGLFGLWTIRKPGFLRFWAPLIFGMLIMTLWGDLWKPQFQLTRAAIPLSFCSVVPAALMLERWLTPRVSVMAWRSGFALALLFYTGVNAARVLDNDSLTAAQYRLRPAYMDEIEKLIREEAPPGTRVLFTGSTVHAFGGGHIAYLPIRTGREMMACDYYHFSPKLVEYEYPPRPFRSEEGMVEFMKLYNVSLVATYRKHWKEWLQKYPDQYEYIASFGSRGQLDFYRYRQDFSLFLEGGGSVTAAVNRIRVKPDDPLVPLTLKYNFDPRLKVRPPAKLFPRAVDGGIELLGIDPGGAEEVEVDFR